METFLEMERTRKGKMTDFLTFKDFLNKYWQETLYHNVPKDLAVTLYSGYLKAYQKKRMSGKDFIRRFFAYVGIGKGLYISI